MERPPICVRRSGGWCEQAEGASLLDGLRVAERAELLIQVPLVRLDGIHRYGQLAVQTAVVKDRSVGCGPSSRLGRPLAPRSPARPMAVFEEPGA